MANGQDVVERFDIGTKLGFYYRHGHATNSDSLTVSNGIKSWLTQNTLGAQGAELLMTMDLSSTYTGSLSDLCSHIQFFEIAQIIC